MTSPSAAFSSDWPLLTLIRVSWSQRIPVYGYGMKRGPPSYLIGLYKYIVEMA